MWTTSDDPELLLRRGQVEDALSAIEYRWEKDKASRWELIAGEKRTFGDATLRVLHPSAEEVAAALAKPPPKDPNTLASPLLVEWHDLRLVLGSDLPKSGWKHVHLRAVTLDLGKHHAFKVAHHGSKGALHDTVLKGSRERLWIATPFHRGRELPCFDDGHGIEGLLKHNDEVALTSLRDVAGSGARPARITRQRVRDARARVARKVLGGSVRTLPRPGMDPGGWIAAGFAKDGSVVDRQYGEGAVVVAEEAVHAAHPVVRSKRSRGRR
jgi:hypothetical protein